MFVEQCTTDTPSQKSVNRAYCAWGDDDLQLLTTYS